MYILIDLSMFLQRLSEWLCACLDSATGGHFCIFAQHIERLPGPGEKHRVRKGQFASEAPSCSPCFTKESLHFCCQICFSIVWPVCLELAHDIIQFCFFLQQESAKSVFVLHGHITAVKSLSFCSSGLALVSGGIGGLLNIWSLQVRKQHILYCTTCST